MNPIYYTLQSSTAVLAVYCNKCKKSCNFCYSWPHEQIALWTHQKKQILCPECAQKESTEVYRKVFSYRDLPINRSFFQTNSSFDHQMFWNNDKNKRVYFYLFCTPEQEANELNGENPVVEPKCNCGECQ